MDAVWNPASQYSALQEAQSVRISPDFLIALYPRKAKAAMLSHDGLEYSILGKPLGQANLLPT